MGIWEVLDSSFFWVNDFSEYFLPLFDIDLEPLKAPFYFGCRLNFFREKSEFSLGKLVVYGYSPSAYFTISTPYDLFIPSS